MITLRLDSELEKMIVIHAKNMGLSKSEFVRKSIHEYLKTLDQPSAWEAGKDLFGKYSSGLGNLSADRKKRVKQKIRAK